MHTCALVLDINATWRPNVDIQRGLQGSLTVYITGVGY